MIRALMPELHGDHLATVQPPIQCSDWGFKINLRVEMSSGKHIRLNVAGNAQHRGFQSLTPIKFGVMTLNSSLTKDKSNTQLEEN